ncbi:MAG: riboflavin synthase [Planctomycetaceae bacterium]
MFTGLVEGRGVVSAIFPQGAAIDIAISPPRELCEDGSAKIGDSIAINGCCLTVISTAGGLWVFQAGEETLSKTSLGSFKVGDAVNLERSLPVDGRLGGHFVQGHVDGTGEVQSLTYDGDWTCLSFEVPQSLARLMVPKGSVAIDGVSLTLVDVERDWFGVALIPHTMEVTTLGLRQVGDMVNIETDILGKYVAKFLEGVSPR